MPSIISRDIVTGIEEEFPSVQRAGDSCNFTPSALKRSFLDQPRQLGGKHWRRSGLSYWCPPKGLIFDLAHTGATTVGYIKAENGDDIRVFESITSASKIMGLDRRTLTSFMDVPTKFGGFTWSKLPYDEWGAFAHNDGEYFVPTQFFSDATLPGEAGSGERNNDGRCRGKIIEHNLMTNIEVVHKSLTRAAASIGVSPHTIKDTFLDKPRQIKGRHFRAYTSKQFWQPPTILKFDPSGFEKNTGGYIISTDFRGNRVMYESMQAAAEFTKVGLWSISEGLKNGNIYGEFLWTRAKYDDYATFLPV